MSREFTPTYAPQRAGLRRAQTNNTNNMQKVGKNYKFPVFIQKDEDGFYFIECPIFKSCYTQGETKEEALENIKEVIELCLEEKDNQEIIKEYKPQNIGFQLLNTKIYA